MTDIGFAIDYALHPRVVLILQRSARFRYAVTAPANPECSVVCNAELITGTFSARHLRLIRDISSIS